MQLATALRRTVSLEYGRQLGSLWTVDKAKSHGPPQRLAARRFLRRLPGLKRWESPTKTLSQQTSTGGDVKKHEKLTIHPGNESSDSHPCANCRHHPVADWG